MYKWYMLFTELFFDSNYFLKIVVNQTANLLQEGLLLNVWLHKS